MKKSNLQLGSRKAGIFPAFLYSKPLRKYKMRIQLYFFFLILVLSSCSTSQKAISQNQHSVSLTKTTPEKKTFFVPVSINKLSPIQTPCIDVNIEGNNISMELDLGFRGDITIIQSVANKFQLKSFLQEHSMYSFRGTKYPTNLYRIPKATIGSMIFHNPTMQEEPEEFVKNSTFVQNGGPPSSRDPGRVGWKLFYKANLLIDIKNSTIAFCDSLETLKNQGYSTEAFIKTPLFLDRGLIEIETNTPEGVMRCVLDTGATWNILNQGIESDQSVDEAAWDPKNLLQYAHFKIEEKEFGPLTFHRLPIKLPFHIDGILGMEFFEENVVFLDFSNGCAYFFKIQARPTK